MQIRAIGFSDGSSITRKHEPRLFDLPRPELNLKK